MVYTHSQENALNRIKEFIGSDADVFILKGYAGTGKTTILSSVLDILRASGKNIRLMAPTGRAANILSQKTGGNAATIHRCIYNFSMVTSKEGGEDEASEVHYYFPLREPEESRQSLVGVIDEASMVSSVAASSEIFRFGSDNVLEDLLSFF